LGKLIIKLEDKIFWKGKNVKSLSKNILKIMGEPENDFRL